jgi:Gamma-glutamyl cyclotransferase, AIG2-like
MSSSVWVFFYGGLINPRILDKVGMKPTRQEPATLLGFDIRISPYVNLVRSAGHTVFGVLMEVTHAELQHTYSQLKARYLPEAVMVSDAAGCLRPALCYIVPICCRGRPKSIMLRRWQLQRRASGFLSGTWTEFVAFCRTRRSRFGAQSSGRRRSIVIDVNLDRFHQHGVAGRRQSRLHPLFASRWC